MNKPLNVKETFDTLDSYLARVPLPRQEHFAVMALLNKLLQHVEGQANEITQLYVDKQEYLSSKEAKF
jgi:hypothetical protein